MQARVPVNYRQSFKWYGNLDATSIAFVLGGGMLAFKVLTGPASWTVKIPAMAVCLGLGALLGLGRWPLEYGDNAVTWLRRAMTYRGRLHSAHLVRSLSPAEAARRTWAYESNGGGRGAVGERTLRGAG